MVNYILTPAVRIFTLTNHSVMLKPFRIVPIVNNLSFSSHSTLWHAGSTLRGITIVSPIKDVLQGLTHNRNMLRGVTVAVGLGTGMIELKVVDRNNRPIQGATCRVLNAIQDSPIQDSHVLNFNGLNSKVEMGDNYDLRTGHLSYEFWMLARSTSGQRGIVGKSRWAGNIGRWTFWFNNNVCSAFIETPHAITIITYPTSHITLNTWHHIAVTIDRNGFMRSYLNGNLMATSASIAVSAGLDLNSTDIFGMGAYQNTTGSIINQLWFDGQLAELRIWNTVRTQQQIINNRHMRINENAAGLIGYYPLNEGTGSIITDRKNPINGIIDGATWQTANIPIIEAIQYGTTYSSGTTNADGITTVNYLSNRTFGLEITMPGRRRFIMPFRRDRIVYLEWQVVLNDQIATFLTDSGDLLINANPQDAENNFLLEI